MKGYKVTEHTADVGLSVKGSDLKELFLNAARGLSYLIKLPKKMNFEFIEEIQIESTDKESLLVSWLNELIYRCFVEKKIYNRFLIDEISGNGKFLKAKIYGKIYENLNFPFEIKAATYHNLKIKEHKGKKKYLSTQIIFDV